MIQAGEYMYCSPEFYMDGAVHVRTGERGPEMLAVALTNRPFQDNIEHVRLLARPSQDTDEDAPPSKDGESAEGDDDAGAPPVQDGDQPPAQSGASTNAPTPVATEAHALVTAMATELGIDEAQALDALKKNAGAIVKALGIALEKKKETEAMADPALMARIEALETEVKQTKDALAQSEEGRASDKAEARVDALIHLGRVLPAQRDMAVREFKRDAGEAEKLFAKVVSPVGQSQAGGNTDVGKTLAVSDLTDVEKGSLVILTHRGFTEEKALERIAARRGN
jgi:hypothetical protein